MGLEGIGARVVRKEDKRFITGRGKYTDDMIVPGMHYAAFGRSPHAHARIRSIDTAAAMSMPGVVAVLDGQQLAADGIGNLICGWMIKSRDGAPMKMGAVPALAKETVRYVGQPFAVVVAETRLQARDAAEAVNVDWEELPPSSTCTRRSRKGRTPSTPRPSATSSMTGRSATAPRWRLPSPMLRT
jgi:carbon-monoxide dehydrogenase large subunit